MKKIALLLAIVMVLSLFSGCDVLFPDSKPDTGEGEPKLVETELLFDRNFEEGIKISNLNSHQVGYTWWKYGESGGDEPFWSLGQYCD